MAVEATMPARFRRFWIEEEGQDLIEYTLLMTFIVIACMWFVGAGHDPVNGIWTTANNSVTTAQTAANGS
jgi:Flp pilus assembly pilin Flp